MKINDLSKQEIIFLRDFYIATIKYTNKSDIHDFYINRVSYFNSIINQLER